MPDHNEHDDVLLDRQKFIALSDNKKESKDEEEDVVSKSLVEWLEHHGASFPNLSLRTYTSQVRGVHARKGISPTERVLRIPLKCLITVEMGKNTAVGQRLLECQLDFAAPKHIFLMMFILTDMEKGPSSFFYPYYQSLPTSLHNVPIFWNDEELKYLTGSYILRQIEDRKNAIARDYNVICDAYQGFESRVSLERFSWARMIVCSRNFGLVINGTKTAAMVPMADMLNHYRPRETSWTFEDTLQSFTITALSPIAASSQVYDSYGKKCNHRFLLNYGFAVTDNGESDGHNPNEVMTLFNLDDNDPLCEHRSRILPKELDLRMSTRHSDPNVKTGFSIARVIVATEDELFHIAGRRDFTSSFSVPPVSIRNEIRALLLLKNLMTRQLGRYKTLLESDNAVLESGSLELFSNECQALIFMRGEKQVCQHYLDLANRMVPMLQLHVTEFRKCVAVLEEEDDSDVSLYAQDIGSFLVEREHRTRIYIK